MAEWVVVSSCPHCGFPIYERERENDIPEVKSTCICSVALGYFYSILSAEQKDPVSTTLPPKEQ